MTLERDVVAALASRGLTVATAESLTAGLVCARLADVPGASAVLRGGVVVYATELKAELLGVSADLLDRHGPVHPQVAAQMATGVRGRCGADVGLATTGVAGPGPADGHPAGTVHVAVDVAGTVTTAALGLPGERAQVRRGTVDALLELTARLLREQAAPDPR